MSHRRTALVSVATLLLGAGLFGATVLPASGEPSTSSRPTLSAEWSKVAVASVAEAKQRMAAETRVAGAQTLVVFAVSSAEAVIDVPPAGISLGDFVLFEEQIYSDLAQTQLVGRDSVRAELSFTTVTFGATFDLPGGKITIAGSVFDEFLPTFPITGGTGQYLGAGGLFVPFGLPSGDTVLIFRIVQ